MKDDREREHTDRGYEIIAEIEDSRIREMNGAMHRHAGYVVKEASQGNQSNDLELLCDELGHRLRENDDEEEYLVHQDEAKRGVDRFEVVVVMSSIEGWYVIEEEDKRKVADKEDNGQPNDELLKSARILGGY
jgi:hypothetical protein